jgi:hypothetical protein
MRKTQAFNMMTQEHDRLSPATTNFKNHTLHTAAKTKNLSGKIESQNQELDFAT